MLGGKRGLGDVRFGFITLAQGEPEAGGEMFIVVDVVVGRGHSFLADQHLAFVHGRRLDGSGGVGGF